MFKKVVFTICILLSLKSILKAQTGDIVIPDGNASVINRILVDKQGKYLYSVDGSKIVMWDIKTGNQLYSFAATDDITQIAISNDGKKLAVGNSSIVCFNTLNGTELFKNTEHYYGGGIDFSEDDSQIYAIYNGLYVIDVRTAKASKIDDNSFKQYHAQVLTLPNNLVAIAGMNGWQVWDALNKKLIFEKTFGKDFRETFFHPMLNYVIFSDDTKFEFYDIITGKLIKILPKVSGDGRFIASSTTNEFLLSSDLYENEKLLVYNGTDFTQKGTLSPGIELKSIFFQGTGKPYFIGALDKTLQYNYGSTKVFREIAGKVIHVGPISPSYSISSGRMTIVSNGTTGKLLDMKRMVTIADNKLGVKPITACYSVSGDTMAIFDHKSLMIKNVRSGKVILPTKPIGSVAESDVLYSEGYFFSNDGKALYYLLDRSKSSGTLLMKMDIATKVVTKKVEFNGITSIRPTADRKLLEVVQGGGDFEAGCIIDIESGKTVFMQSFPKTDATGRYNEPGETYIKLSSDKKKVVFAHQDMMAVYDYPSGQQISGNIKMPFLDKFGKSASNSELSQVITADRDGNFDVYNIDGQKQYTVNNAHKSAIQDIKYAPDDKVFYTFSYDQTIKTWNAANGKLLGTLYLFDEGSDYVFVNKDGRFDGTPEGIKKLYYVKDRKVVTLDKIYEKFYTPNLYQRLLNGEEFDPINIIIKETPKVKIAYAEATRNLDVEEDLPTYQNKTGFADIVVNAIAEDDGIDEIRLFHNGKIVTLTTRNLIVADNEGGSQTKKYQLTLLPGINNVRAIALNTQRTESEPDEIVVNYNVAANNTPVVVKPVNSNGAIVSPINKDATLHLIVVGINDYQNKSMSLNYAMADATSFKEEVEKDARSIIANIKTYFVSNNTADKTGITNAFKQVQQTAKAQDVFIFYYAGHGVIGKDKEFYLVPTDVSDLKNVQTELEQKGIASKLLQQYAIDIQAQKQLFILDACQSAGAFEKLLSNDGDQQKSLAVVARSTGTHWMAASGAMQFANEFSSLGHGVFTYVLLQALKGEAANNKMITVNGLKNFLQVQVPLLMKKYNGAEQYPASYGFGNDFPVEVMK